MSKVHSDEGTLAKFTQGVIHTVSPARRTGALTSDNAVLSGSGVYRGYTVTVATALAAIQILDATSAGAGVVIDVIPAGTAVGTTKERNTTLTTGLFVDYGVGATGTLIVEYL
jgi:hypothetical protein